MKVHLWTGRGRQGRVGAQRAPIREGQVQVLKGSLVIARRRMAKREIELQMLTLDVVHLEEGPRSITPDMEMAEAGEAAEISPRSHRVLDGMLERSVRGCLGEHSSLVERGLFVAISTQNFEEEDISPGMKRGRAHFDDEDDCDVVMSPTDVVMLHPDGDEASPTSVCDSARCPSSPRLPWVSSTGLLMPTSPATTRGLESKRCQRCF